MPVKRPKRKRTAGAVKTSGVGTKKNAGVARRAGRGKLGGGVMKATPTKRAGKPKGKLGMRVPGTQDSGQYPGTYTPAPKPKKKKPAKTKGK